MTKTTLIFIALLLSFYDESIAQEQRPLNVFVPIKEYNDVTVLNPKTTQRYVDILKSCYLRLAKMSDNKVLKLHCTIAAPAENKNHGPVVIGGQRYGLLVTWENKSHKSVLAFQISAISDRYPVEWIIFDYNNAKRIGYLSDISCPTRTSRSYVSVEQMREKFERMISMLEQIISKL